MLIAREWKEDMTTNLETKGYAYRISTKRAIKSQRSSKSKKH